MDNTKKKHVFGPVPSRRFGRSLGVDLVPFKTCTHDCIYCELGRTTCRTLERKPYVNLEEILRDLDQALPRDPDIITLAGSGEPTLHSQIGELITAIKKRTSIPVGVLTNGALLFDPQVRRELASADIVAPSLDAGDRKTFAAVHQPHPDLDFDKVIAGMVDFGREFAGQIWLEVFFMEGYTANDDQAEKMAIIARAMSPYRIQINTVTRPPAMSSARPVSKEQLERYVPLFGDRCEVIASFSAGHPSEEFGADIVSEILDSVSRRPQTVEDLANGLGANAGQIAKAVEAMEADGKIRKIDNDGKVFYIGA